MRWTEAQNQQTTRIKGYHLRVGMASVCRFGERLEARQWVFLVYHHASRRLVMSDCSPDAVRDFLQPLGEASLGRVYAHARDRADVQYDAEVDEADEDGGNPAMATEAADPVRCLDPDPPHCREGRCPAG
jgi:hypothetical protein